MGWGGEWLQTGGRGPLGGGEHPPRRGSRDSTERSGSWRRRKRARARTHLLNHSRRHTDTLAGTDTQTYLCVYTRACTHRETENRRADTRKSHTRTHAPARALTHARTSPRTRTRARQGDGGSGTRRSGAAPAADTSARTNARARTRPHACTHKFSALGSRLTPTPHFAPTPSPLEHAHPRPKPGSRLARLHAAPAGDLQRRMRGGRECWRDCARGEGWGRWGAAPTGRCPRGR